MSSTIVTKLLMCCAVALVTALLPCSASAQYWVNLFHSSEFSSLCINLAYQDDTDGKQIAANVHCDFTDPASVWRMEYGANPLEIEWSHNKCIDNRYGDQSNWNPVVIWVCNGGESQKWDWDGNAGGLIRYHANPNKCLTIKWNVPGYDGVLMLFDCIGQGNQKFVREYREINEQSSRGGSCTGANKTCGNPWECICIDK
jgi:hypothetical protein